MNKLNTTAGTDRDEAKKWNERTERHLDCGFPSDCLADDPDECREDRMEWLRGIEEETDDLPPGPNDDDLPF